MRGTYCACFYPVMKKADVKRFRLHDPYKCALLWRTKDEKCETGYVSERKVSNSADGTPRRKMERRCIFATRSVLARPSILTYGPCIMWPFAR